MRLAKVLGVTAQALVLGALLFLAILKILSPALSVRVFQYQGF